jgi:putative N6-adenine-specific DNA methylase
VDAAALAAGARSAVAARGDRGGHREPRDRTVARGEIDLGALLHPDRSFALQATATGSAVANARWALLSVKDGLVDGQRDRWGRRSDVDREQPDVSLRLRLAGNRAALLLDTSGAPLDRRGYRVVSTAAPVREQLAAACVLASGWDGSGPVVDPMCGSATLLIEAGWIALGLAPGHLRADWAFERLPFFRAADFAAVRAEPIPAGGAGGPAVRLYGNDRSPQAIAAARTNLERAGLADRAVLRCGEASALTVPPGPGLVVVNPPHGGRVATDPGAWRALGDLLKQRFKGWQAAVLAGGPDRGKLIGLRPRRRIPVMNGPLAARILLFDLY